MRANVIRHRSRHSPETDLGAYPGRTIGPAPKPDGDVAEQLLLMARTTRHGVLITDELGFITWCNEAVTRRSACPTDDIIGRSLCGFLQDHQGEPGNLAHLRTALEQGLACCTTLLDRARDGREHWLNIDLQPVPDAAGSVRSFVVVQTDITEQVQSNQHFKSLIDSTAAGIALMDHLGHIVDCNPEAERLLGQPRRQLLGHAVADPLWQAVREDGTPFPDDERPTIRALKTGLPVHGVVVGVTLPSGARRWLLLNSQLVTGHTGSQRRVVTSFTDLTVQKTMHAELIAERQRLAATLEGTGAGTWEWNAITGETRFNELWAQILGYSTAELEPTSLRTMTDQIHPDDRARSERMMRAHFARELDYYNLELRVRHRTGRWIWVRTRGRVATWTPEGRAWMMFGTTVDITTRKELEQELLMAARNDRLTGLPNRESLIERIQQAAAGTAPDSAGPFAVLFLDFDRFKLVNDTMGHAAGDLLLKRIAGRLRSAMSTPGTGEPGRHGDFIARFGGDEFVVLLNDIADPEQALAIANRLIDVAAPPHLIRDKEVHSTVSIGIALGRPGCDGAEDLLRNADMAMYEAKREGRARAKLFDESMHTRLERATKIEHALRYAIDAHQLTLVYQPIVNLETGIMTSAEALVRWTHPELGVVSPAEFVPIAEDSGLIVPIGEWVLRQACGQWAAWQRENPSLAPATISVNLSRVQMNLGDQLPVLVQEVLDRSGMQAHHLQLEVTEREVMREPGHSRALMDKLHAMGVKLAMDDFGTGTSSLGCLRELPFDVIKIDKSFVDELASSADGMAVIHATVNVVRNLGMTSVAEGIEEQAQVGILQSLGCDFGQGYFFSRPVAGDKLLEVMGAKAAEAAEAAVVAT